MMFTQVLPGDTEEWPKGRSGHRMCADQNFLYVYGGYNPEDNNKTYNELWRYNTSTSKWLKLPDHDSLAPLSCASSSMVLWKNNIFIFGGTGYPFATTNSNDLFMYSLSSYKWVNLSNLDAETSSENIKMKTKECGCLKIVNSPPLPKYGQSMTVSPCNRLFIFSGTVGQDFPKELHSFCLKKLRWTEYRLCNEHDKYVPSERYRHESVTIKNQFFVMGGSTLHRYFQFDKLQSFQYAKNEWKEIHCKSKSFEENSMVFPKPRKAHSCVSYNNDVYMVAGVGSNKQSLDDVWKYNTEICSWEKFKVCNQN